MMKWIKIGKLLKEVVLVERKQGKIENIVWYERSGGVLYQVNRI